MSRQRILFVLTGHDRLGAADDERADRTGYHLFEAARPWSILADAGIDVDFVTPDGNTAPIDPSSMDLSDEYNARFLGDDNVQQELKKARALKDVKIDDYDGIYFPGGHGTMWDLPDHAGVQAAIRKAFEAGKIVAAVCHGPAALVNVKLSDGSWLVDGKTVSTFTDAEEKAVEKDSLMPFLLGSKLEERGATLEKAENFEASVSVDGNLVTGQNPASAEGVGREILKLIEQQGRAAA